MVAFRCPSVESGGRELRPQLRHSQCFSAGGCSPSADASHWGAGAAGHSGRSRPHVGRRGETTKVLNGGPPGWNGGELT